MEPRKLSLKSQERCHSQTWRTVPCPHASIGSHQRGLALITAMLVIAISVTAVTYMAFNQSVWIHQGQNLIDRTQADAVAYRYIQAAADLLSDVAIENKKKGVQYDDDKARWNIWPGQDREGWEDKDLEALGGKLTGGKITDAQAKFNFNNILDWQKNPPTENAADKNTLQKILTNLSPNLNRDLVNAMLDWIDPNNDPLPNGAEDIDYMNVAPPRLPYRAANQAFTSLDELRLVKGFDAEIVNELKKTNLVTALPTKMNGAAVLSPVNVNTASDDVLLALFPGLTTTTLATFTGGRPYKTVADVGNNPKVPLTSVGTAPPAILNYGVSTSYFEVDITVKIGKVERRTLALIYRPPTPARPQIVQISYPAVEKPKKKKDSESDSAEDKPAFGEEEDDEADQ